MGLTPPGSRSSRFIEQADPGYRRDGLIQIANAWRFTQGEITKAGER